MFLSVIRSSSSRCARSGSVVIDLHAGAFADDADGVRRGRATSRRSRLPATRTPGQRRADAGDVTIDRDARRGPGCAAAPGRTGNSMRCCTSTGAVMRVAMPARSPVSEWQVVHLPVAVEVGLTGLRIAGQDVPDGEERRSPQRVVDTLPEELHQIDGLRLRQLRRSAARSASGWPFSKNGPSRRPAGR